MNDGNKTPWVLAGITLMMLGLTAAFRSELWGRPEPMPDWPPVDASFTNTATVRQSAAELIASEGDTSGLECYACHEKGKPPTIHLDDKGQVKLPEEHNDLVMLHGRHGRNVHCFNCHDPENLDTLKTRDGRSLKWAESTQLCASCHGPTYRDWEIGIHGRVSGHWDRSRGPHQRVECASCHHPHAPQFPSLPPAPAPRALHEKGGDHDSNSHSNAPASEKDEPSESSSDASKRSKKAAREPAQKPYAFLVLLKKPVGLAGASVLPHPGPLPLGEGGMDPASSYISEPSMTLRVASPSPSPSGRGLG